VSGNNARGNTLHKHDATRACRALRLRLQKRLRALYYGESAMPRTPNDRNTYNNRDSYGTENFSDHDRSSYEGDYGSQFYQGDRDEGRPRPAPRNRGRFSEEEHVQNAANTYGGRSERNERGSSYGGQSSYRRQSSQGQPSWNRSAYRPSGDWNGDYNSDYDDGRYSSTQEATQGRSTRAQTYGHTAYGQPTYGSGRYETDYDTGYNARTTSRDGGYARSERPEYNRFDQDHDEHGGYSFRGRSWTSGDALESERPHGELYGSTVGESDHGRSRFRSADNDWHLPTPPHNDELERYNNRFSGGRSNAERYGTGGRGYSTSPARKQGTGLDDAYYGSSRYGNARADNRGSNTTGAGYGRTYRDYRNRDDDDIETGGVD
jgi:hypothetical protein